MRSSPEEVPKARTWPRSHGFGRAFWRRGGRGCDPRDALFRGRDLLGLRPSRLPAPLNWAGLHRSTLRRRGKNRLRRGDVGRVFAQEITYRLVPPVRPARATPSSMRGRGEQRSRQRGRTQRNRCRAIVNRRHVQAQTAFDASDLFSEPMKSPCERSPPAVQD